MVNVEEVGSRYILLVFEDDVLDFERTNEFSRLLKDGSRRLKHLFVPIGQSQVAQRGNEGPVAIEARDVYATTVLFRFMNHLQL